jgi:xylulose-5-phosphate/fructose-6-phosphate phosphoketolase
MPKQEIAQANPPPDSSQLPDALLKLKIDLVTSDALSDGEVEAIRKFRRAADYIAAGELAQGMRGGVLD